MKKILSVLIAGFIGGFTACTPDRYDYKEMEPFDMGQAKELSIKLNHYQLLADGKAQIEFIPKIYSMEDNSVPFDRIDHSKIEYYSVDGMELAQEFSTSDRNLIGKEIRAYAKIKGQEIYSDTLSFTVVDPSAVQAYTEITVPVIFHVFRNSEAMSEYGGDIAAERIWAIVDKLNNTFSGSVSRNATGVDTKVRFKAALYDPYGRKLPEAGINRIYTDAKIKEASQYTDLIHSQKALWSCEKYLNVWLVADAEGDQDAAFYHQLSMQCHPRYVVAGANLANQPQGLELNDLPVNWTPQPKEVGIFYRLRTILHTERYYGKDEENELVNVVGTYFGLLPTWNDKYDDRAEDYCSDTHYYQAKYEKRGISINIGAYKNVDPYYFLAENIMDDQLGVHRSVSLQQSQRVRWVLNNCPERWCWKSDYAFTGRK